MFSHRTGLPLQLRLNRRHHDQRGAILVEASLCLLLLLVISAGILEYSSLFGSTIDVAGAARSAARVGSATTTEVVSDDAVIDSLTDKQGLRRTDIEKLVIYRSDAGTQAPPGPCMNVYPPPPGQKCDVYLAADLAATPAARAGNPATQGWPTSERVPGTDYIGIWIRVKHSRLTGLIWTPTQFTDNFSMRIDPITPPSNVDPMTNNAGDWQTGSTGIPDWGSNWYCWNGVCPAVSGVQSGGGGAGQGSGGA